MKAEMSMEYRVGTSGWHYEHWRGRFYPMDLPKSKWLEYYARRFDTVEVNNSFYRLPSEKAFRNWYDQSPEGFIFALKASRIITHYRKLKNIHEPLSTFLGRAANLKEKLGPVLYQLPPTLKRDDPLLAEFVSALPEGVRHVVEFRHRSWYEEPVFEILRRRGIGYCIVSQPGFESPFTATGRFAYIRFHGRTALYAGSYSDSELARWALKIQALERPTDEVFAYFNNDAEANAVFNAQELIRKLSERPIERR
ncbi:MAG: DUF72 domain-containing protein [Chloroflexi bacterium]|nr:DUF72 domain-containing protein [Chloroflexota bacterium]